MRDSKDRCIEIEDIEPKVFKALLHFIYTDTLCPSDGHGDQGADEDNMVQQLIVASNRYNLDRLKLICEDKLAQRICLDNMLTTLILATQNNCRYLENIRLDYISSAENLHSVIETDVFRSLTVSNHSIYEELLKKIAIKMNMIE